MRAHGVGFRLNAKSCMTEEFCMRTLFILALLGAAAPAFADSVLDLRASFPEVKPYSGPISPAVTGDFGGDREPEQ